MLFTFKIATVGDEALMDNPKHECHSISFNNLRPHGVRAFTSASSVLSLSIPAPALTCVLFVLPPPSLPSHFPSFVFPTTLFHLALDFEISVRSLQATSNPKLRWEFFALSGKPLHSWRACVCSKLLVNRVSICHGPQHVPHFLFVFVSHIFHWGWCFLFVCFDVHRSVIMYLISQCVFQSLQDFAMLQLHQSWLSNFVQPHQLCHNFGQSLSFWTNCIHQSSLETETNTSSLIKHAKRPHFPLMVMTHKVSVNIYQNINHYGFSLVNRKTVLRIHFQC